MAMIIGMGIITIDKAVADDLNNNQNPKQSLVQKIADRFGLKKEDVQTVFDQERKKRQTDRETKFLSYLDQLIKDNKITAAQKLLIINKHKEIAVNHQKQILNPQGKTDEERKTLIEEKRKERETERKSLEDWATQNGIDIKYLMGGFGGRGEFGRRGGFKSMP